MTLKEAREPEPPVDLLVLTAVSVEYSVVKRVLWNHPKITYACPLSRERHCCHATTEQHSIAAVQMGIGPKQAAKTMQWALEEFRPRRVLVLGLAGGLSADLACGDLIEATTLKSTVSEDDIPLAPRIDSEAAAGVIVSSPKAVCTVEDKASLHQEQQADAVDMESYTVASLCQQHDIEVSVLRAICDDAMTAFPAETVRLLTPLGNLSSMGIALFLLMRPKRIGPLLTLGKATRRAEATLYRACERLIDNLMS